MDLNSITALLSQLGVSNDPIDLSGGTWGGTPQYLDPSTSGFTGMMPPDRTNLDNTRASLLEYILKQQPKLQQAKPVQPAFRTQDALTGLLPILLMGAFGGKRGWQAADQYGQGYIGGKMQKAQMDTDTERQRVDMSNRDALGKHEAGFDALRAQLGFAEQDYGRDYGEYTRGVQDKEMLKRIQEQQKGLNYRADLKADDKAIDQAIKAIQGKYGTTREAGLGILHSEGRISDETYNRLLPIVKQEDAGERNLNAKTQTENELRDPRVKQAKANVDKTLAATNLSDAQKSLILKKVEHYDAEFKARVAEINSRIAKRTADIALGKARIGGKSENEEIADRNRLIGIARAQIKRIEESGLGVMDVAKRMQVGELEQEIAMNESRIQEIVQGRMSRGETTYDASEIEAANQAVQRLLSQKKITQAEANSRWRQIKAAAGG